LYDLKAPVKLNEKMSAFTLRIPAPGEKLGIAELRSLAPEAVDLDFPVLSADNVQYFNALGMETYTGISFLLPGERGNGSARLLVGGTPASRMGARAGPAEPPEELEPPFNLVWDHVTGDNGDLSAEEPLGSVSVISPTWFSLAGPDGEVANRGSVSYVKSAHKRGLQVWALVSNSFDKARTTKFLASESARDAFIARMLAYARIYGFDGINIDFEGVAGEDAAKLTSFVRQISEAARANGLIMSIDVMVPTKWSKAYQRKELSKIVDYVAVMTYDEHWRTAPKAGSTASLPWVRAALQRTMAEVPASKLLLGIPLYTREWTETKPKKGAVKVSSRALGMASVDVRQSETSSSLKWLPDIGQNYFQFVEDGKTHKIWVEDEKSLELRLELVRKNRLAGAAFWRKGFEKPEIWELVGKMTEQDKR
jgi:spore germination protein YaaH